jgi:hypothetical protein
MELTIDQPAHQQTHQSLPPARDPSSELLERNLRALTNGKIEGRSANAIAAIRSAVTDPNLRLVRTADGQLTGTTHVNARPHRLASAIDPALEADRFAKSIDLAAAATIIVRGFGIGAHVEALARRVKFAGAIIVFEPDAALLRAVFERVDCTPWLRFANIAIVTDPNDTAAIAAAAQSIEGILAAGTQLVDHPPSRARLAATAQAFGENFATVMKAVRTTVLTTLVQVDVTVRNYLQNAEWYISRPGIAQLRNLTPGVPAIVVSAGPSLRRNIDVLARECAQGLRNRAVIIAAQTVLKQLLAKGIKPHFVTALDYHEISKRFYEGLTAQDVEGVTLLAEPKCNPAILEAWPGKIRLAGNEVLDQIIGEHLVRPMGDITPGATVAHLSYYLARYLGCDPVILTGQDLGFTDGQYYAPNAAIHHVWANELNEFNTLEMLEWQRIARMRSLLRKVQDQHGRPMYTDEQMATYLVQFERDFAKDSELGLTIIDATEGGSHKRHTRLSTLHSALQQHATNPNATAPLQLLPSSPTSTTKEQLRARFALLRKDANTLASLSDDTASLLAQMIKDHHDQARVNQLIDRTHKNAQRAMSLSAYWLTQYINQTGQLNRYRADRSIAIDDTLTPMERQKRQIERDITNVRWIADAARHTASLVREAAAALESGVRITRDETPQPRSAPRPPRVKTAACVWLNPAQGGLGQPRDLAAPFAPGLSILEATLTRLARCTTLDHVLLITPPLPSGTDRSIFEQIAVPRSLKLEIIEAAEDDAPRRRAVATGRLWARHCWRGGLADLSCYDEAFSPTVLAPILESRKIDAAVILAADWCLIDPALIDAAVTQHRERPDACPLVFTQAPPGLAACVISRSLVAECAAGPSAFSTIGGMLGYIPIAPQGDPIAKPCCVPVPASVRDRLDRIIPDSPAMLNAIRTLIAAHGQDWIKLKAEEVTAQLPQALAVETMTLAATTTGFDATSLTHAQHAIHEASARNPIAVTLDTREWSHFDPTRDTDALRNVMQSLRAVGAAAIHVRTGPLTTADAQALLPEGSTTTHNPDIISIDCIADRPETLDTLAGPFTHTDLSAEQLFAQNRDAIDLLLERRNETLGLPAVWIVPRITRRDAVYEQIEGFYNRALLTAGAGVIDPLPAAVAGERIEPLPPPANVLARRAATHINLGPHPVASPATSPAPSPATNTREAA